MSPLLAPPVDTLAAPSPLPSPLAHVHSLPVPGPLDGPFYGETIPIVLWPTSLNGISGLIHLAMHILSIVPNSAATERIFSQFGVIHTKITST
ncbi:hypothetical protein K503DRAFT_806888 [Rhizopogon vinicolor AM-OR11-026]|uniref:HAT C-terminal dimerisation domain-containing protein n=1 Tax=Rhizopogon vinicolor AM-OR11-026 TaxID=1314800 RepID=A0A1B7MDK1_9AGAM|nr:hypothetical protein K503DRAFT_806888 [Rhizopogon vinicolor AM-OR11-026]